MAVVVVIIFIDFVAAHGLVTVKQAEVTANVGDNVTMYCNTTLVEASVDWRRKLHSADRFEIFCYRGSVVRGREDKFSSSVLQNGSYEVVVKNVQLNDSGEYRCIETVNNPSYGTIMLSVEGKNSTLLR